ncbi:hypothetical protein [Ferroacidibacillus organovorans]|nr:hypothetical protein [Ferroacidibacillus organovorans]
MTVDELTFAVDPAIVLRYGERLRLRGTRAFTLSNGEETAYLGHLEC